MNAIGNTAGILHIIFYCLVHTQLSREFADEFERHQLRLDILQIRLSCQVKTLGTIDNVKSSSSSLTINENTSNPQERTVAVILAAVQAALHKAQRDAARMRVHLSLPMGTSTSTAQPLPLDGYASFGQPKKRPQTLDFLDKGRVQTAKAIGAMKWAFYKRDRFDRVIADISALVDDLERFLIINQG
jgi:hypothetical protein